jgi:hypothetical protein
MLELLGGLLPGAREAVDVCDRRGPRSDDHPEPLQLLAQDEVLHPCLLSADVVREVDHDAPAAASNLSSAREELGRLALRVVLQQHEVNRDLEQGPARGRGSLEVGRLVELPQRAQPRDRT